MGKTVAFVVVEEKGQEILRVELRGPTMAIGRDESNDLRLENRALSRKHAQLELRGATVWIRDLASQNGTFINGERLDGAQAINPGDQVSLGGRFDLRIDGLEEPKPAATPVLTLTGPEGSHRFAMVGDEIVIGRSPDCDISIGRKSISRRHLRVVLKDGGFFAEDLGSQNGTRVNGERIRGMTAVTEDDEIRVSEYTIKVGYLDPGADEARPTSGSNVLQVNKGDADAALDGLDDADDVPPPPPPARKPEPAKASAGGGSLGGLDWEEGDERGDTQGYQPQNPARSLPSTKPGLLKGPLKPATAPNPLGLSVPSKSAVAKDKEASLEVHHADGSTRTLKLKKEPVFLAEDGSPEPPPPGMHYPPTGYLAVVPTPQGWVALGVGDRRFPVVAGQPAPLHPLKDGVEVEFGGLTATFRDG